MDISNWSNKELIKFLTARFAITQSKLGDKVFKILDKDYKSGTFASKVVNNNLKLEEIQAICDILGYKIILEEKNKN